MGAPRHHGRTLGVCWETGRLGSRRADQFHSRLLGLGLVLIGWLAMGCTDSAVVGGTVAPLPRSASAATEAAGASAEPAWPDPDMLATSACVENCAAHDLLCDPMLGVCVLCVAGRCAH